MQFAQTSFTNPSNLGIHLSKIPIVLTETLIVTLNQPLGDFHQLYIVLGVSQIIKSKPHAEFLKIEFAFEMKSIKEFRLHTNLFCLFREKKIGESSLALWFIVEYCDKRNIVAYTVSTNWCIFNPTKQFPNCHHLFIIRHTSLQVYVLIKIPIN